MATIPIIIEVEDVAAGPVAILLRKTPGVIKFHMDLDAFAPNRQAQRVPGGPSIQEAVIAALVKRHGGPLFLREIAAETGVSKQPLHGALNSLGKKQVVKTGKERGQWMLTDKARRDLIGNTVKLLPKPQAHAAKKNGGDGRGRTPPGSMTKALLSALSAGPVTRTDLRNQLKDSFASIKAVDAAIWRNRRDGMLKEKDGMVELTAKGQKQQQTAEVASATTES